MTPAYVVVVLNTGFMCLGLRTLHPMESNVQNKWINEWKVTHACYFIFLSSPRLTEPSLATVIMSRVASSICDQDQNWIKQSKIFLRADQWIKITSKLQKYAKIKIKNAQIQFDLWPIKTQAIKTPWLWDNQGIKHTFCQSKILILVTNTSTGDISDYPLHTQPTQPDSKAVLSNYSKYQGQAEN